MRVFPDWHDPLHVPTVGDDVRILHVVMLDARAPREQTFQVSVQPRSATGVLSDRALAIADLLQTTHGATALFLNRYLRSTVGPEGLGKLRVDLKNLLENYRSALEYAAHYMAARCAPPLPPDQVQFPVANSNDTAATFARKLDRWFPGLETSAPKVRDHVLSIQGFSGEKWLRQLHELTNFNKHRCLSPQEIGLFRSVVVRYDGIGLRFGELGLQSLRLEKGGTLRFQDAAGQRVDLDVPCVLDGATSSILSADPRIEIVREERQLYRIPGQQQSLATTVWSLAKNVFRRVISCARFCYRHEKRRTKRNGTKIAHKSRLMNSL
jgi:hypothetical protein